MMLRPVIFLSVIVLTIALCCSCTNERFLSAIDSHIQPMPGEPLQHETATDQTASMAKLGAGDGIGAEIFDQYVAFAKAQETQWNTRLAGITVESSEQDFLSFLQYGSQDELYPQSVLSNVDPSAIGE